MNSYRTLNIEPPVLEDASFDRFVVFDIETTGLSRSEDIIEIGALKIAGTRATEKFSTFVKPSKPIPYNIQQITGITNEFVADAPSIDTVIRDFIEFAGDNILLGHNIVSFDSKFICKAAEKLGLRIKNPLFDTLTYAKRLKKAQCCLPQSLALASLVDHFGIEVNAHHRAFDDALATAKVFLCLKALEAKYNK